MAEVKHTQFAMAALGFADLFNMKIGDEQVDGHRVELGAPDGPSTGGGVQAVQHIKLVPSRGGSVIVAGSANPIERVAEIRSYQYLEAIHQQRFRGAPLPLDRAKYQRLIGRMTAFFAEERLRVVMLDAPKVSAAPVAAPSAAPAPVQLAVIAAAVVVAIAAVVVMLLKSRG